MTNNSLDARGGSESYLEVIAQELRRLGHEVVLFSPRCGAVADTMRRRSFVVVDDIASLPEDFDVIHGQHVTAVALVRPHLPTTPLVFATHSWFVPIEDPLSSLGAGAYLCFNDVTLHRLRARDDVDPSTIHRLRQPVEISFADGRREPIRQRARQALVVSRGVNARMHLLQETCEEVGIALVRIGGEGSASSDARIEMLSADIVFAIGRTALEAMATGRAVFILDEATTGGWVTEESYPALEAGGFVGLESEVRSSDVGRLLADYSPELGVQARSLAVGHHSVQHHAVQLVEIYRSVLRAPVKMTPTTSPTLLAAENMALETRLREEQSKAAQILRDAVDATQREEGLIAERDALSQELEAMAHTFSWRITAPLRAVRKASARFARRSR